MTAPANSHTATSGGLRSARGWIMLCADDYAMTEGVTRSILELASAARLSATSAMTTSRHWPDAAEKLARARDRVSTGLHVNLTLGPPLGPLPRLAPGGKLPTIGDITAQAIGGKLDTTELRAEIARQCAAFEDAVGHPPDHIDGHQHVHALPQVRDALVAVLTERYGASPVRPLVRDPTDRISAILRRGRAVPKALTLAWLGRGFGASLRAAGFPVNAGFAGVTGFDETTVAGDFTAAIASPGVRHLVMCHPGYVDDELVRIDPVTDRRRAEHAFLLSGGFPGLVWRPQRSADGPPVDWISAWQAPGQSSCEQEGSADG